MNDELFAPTAVASLSPRLIWMRKHSISATKVKNFKSLGDTQFGDQFGSAFAHCFGKTGKVSFLP